MAANIEQQLIEKVRALPPDKQQELLNLVEQLSTPASPKKSIWEEIREIVSDVPDEVWERMPVDGAEQHDHYLYGAPKR